MRGYGFYTHVWCNMPNTSTAIIEKMGGVDRQSVFFALAGMQKLGLAHRCGVALSTGARNVPISVWARGPGVSVPLYSRRVSTRRPKASMIAWASIMSELEKGGTIMRIADATGVTDAAIRGVVKILRSYGKVYRMGWDYTSSNTLAAEYMLGEGEDVRRPPRKSQKQSSREYYERQPSRRAANAIAQALAA